MLNRTLTALVQMSSLGTMKKVVHFFHRARTKLAASGPVWTWCALPVGGKGRKPHTSSKTLRRPLEEKWDLNWPKAM